MADVVEGSASWAIPWPCLYGFRAIATHPRICAPPTPLARALDQVDAWLESPTGRDCALLVDGRIAGPMVHHARIAALCRLHGVRELWPADRDLRVFPALWS